MADEYRCFLAINIYQDLIEKIESIQKEFEHNNIKYVEKENLHFTLKFFGNMATDKIKKIKESIEIVLADISIESIDNNKSKIELRIKGIGTFPNKNYMKVSMDRY